MASYLLSFGEYLAMTACAFHVSDIGKSTWKPVGWKTSTLAGMT
jgi:hypothetical protein